VGELVGKKDIVGSGEGKNDGEGLGLIVG